MKSLTFYSLLLSLFSCATSNQVIGPDGTEYQIVNCEKERHCRKEAKKICKGNYELLNTDTEIDSAAFNGMTVTTFNFLVKCQ